MYYGGARKCWKENTLHNIKKIYNHELYRLYNWQYSRLTEYNLFINKIGFNLSATNHNMDIFGSLLNNLMGHNKRVHSNSYGSKSN